jgi:hypothetical protein
MLRTNKAEKPAEAASARPGARGRHQPSGTGETTAAGANRARRASPGRAWEIPIIVLLLAVGGPSRAVEVDVDQYEKTVEAKRFVETFGFIDRYREIQKEFLTQLAKVRSVQEAHRRSVSEVLDEADCLGQLAAVAGMYLTREDLIATNRYFAEGVGRRELEMLRNLEQMVRRGELDPSEAPSSSSAFYESLSITDREQVIAFRQSPSGKRFEKAMAAIKEKVALLFLANLKAAIPAAHDQIRERGRDVAAKPPPTVGGAPATAVPAMPTESAH